LNRMARAAEFRADMKRQLAKIHNQDCWTHDGNEGSLAGLGRRAGLVGKVRF